MAFHPVAGLVGFPINYSLSPRIHRYWLSLYGILGDYHLYPLPTLSFPEDFLALFAPSFVGCNITAPYKQRVIPLLDSLTDTAFKTSSVNLVFPHNGRLIGDCTDGIGFMADFSSQFPDFSFSGATVCLLGAGGVASALIPILLESGIKHCFVVNRDFSRSLTLFERFGDRIIPLAFASYADGFSNASLIIHGTSLGHNGDGLLPVDFSMVSLTTLVYDVVYGDTPFVRAARKRGLSAVDGRGMLLHQAVPSFQRFFGITPLVDDTLFHTIFGS